MAVTNPLIGKVGKHPTYRDCSFVVTQTGSANFFGPDHVADAERFAKLVNGAVPTRIIRQKAVPFQYDEQD
jgi:hypothetical protein